MRANGFIIGSCQRALQNTTITMGFFFFFFWGFIVKMHLLKVDREKLIERRVVSGVEWMARLQRCAYC
uniref:Uncharacterized protein n=1 Tax=Anguilla anguilla TaxID=7936 RepID=A0A0E9PG49_ANGAN